MNWRGIVFLLLVVNQLAATVVFVAAYVRASDWRRSAAGRHILYWSLAAGALDLTWLMLLLARWPWLVFVLFAVQAVFGGLTWQRVALVLRPRRSDG